ncbi:MAG TPA: crotonase/enoyl-CoA hydratase family protein [Dehalococcoidia bacterium]|nr:crotonase/enoyl-CoA hydratase family protein [Dehalococcoidia bacterium]
MDYETILYEVEGGKARITLNRPEKLNSLTMKLQRELNQALWDADNDTRVHVVILRAAGRAFCAGYDLTPMQSPPPRKEQAGEERYTHVYRGMATMDDDIWQLERQQRERMAIWDVHKPVIAQVHGYCLAGGTDLALLCDIVVAAEDAVIGFPPVRAMGSPVAHMWTYLVGPQWAKYFLLTGDSVTGREAAEIGLVWKAVPVDALEDEVEALASKMEKIDIELLSPNKRIVNVAMELMGARTVQRLAAENDGRAHQAPAVREFGRIAMTQGLKAALEWRDGKFGDSRTSAEYQRRRAEQEARARREEA